MPASNPAFFEKAARSKAHAVFLDLEDAVAPSQKAAARRHAIEALNDIDWGTKALQVRINGLDTEYMYRDVIDLVEACPRLDMLLIPKVGVAADVYAVDMLVTQIELAIKRPRRVGFDVLIETALGMANVEAIATSSRRLEALSFGVGNYAASTRAREHASTLDRDRRWQRRIWRAQRARWRQGLSSVGPVAVRPVARTRRVQGLRPSPHRRAFRRLL